MSKNWICSWQSCFSKTHGQYFHFGKLCGDHGYSYHWTSGQKPHLIKDGRKIECNTANYVPIVVPVPSTGSSSSATPTSPTLLPQEAVTPTQHPASTRSERRKASKKYGETRRVDQQKSKIQINMKTTKEIRQNGYKSLRRILWTLGVPQHPDAPASSSREPPLEPRGKVVSGKHSIYTHFPKDRNCDICLRIKITRTPCRKRTGTVVPRADFL